MDEGECGCDEGESASAECKAMHWSYRGLDDFPEEQLEKFRRWRLDVYLKGNKITKLPQNPHRLRSLRELYLNENFIKCIPKQLCLLPYLRCLNVSCNLLTTIPEEIAHLKELCTLIVDGNRIERLPLSLQLMPKLKTISANDNNLFWLPQKIGNNFYSTAFSFWGNPNLHCVPYKIWLHVLKNKTIPSADHRLSFVNRTKQLKCKKESKILKLCKNQWEFVVPYQFIYIEQYPNISPPSLSELCFRNLYMFLNKDKTTKSEDLTLRQDHLPKHLNEKLQKGPTGICDLFNCQCPLFEYSIITATVKYDKDREILVVAYFCSKLCNEIWRETLRIQPIDWIRIS